MALTNKTINTLDKVREKLQECRNLIDGRLYWSGEPVPQEDVEYGRKVYAAICKAMDLL